MRWHPFLQTHISQPFVSRVLLAFFPVSCDSGLPIDGHWESPPIRIAVLRNGYLMTIGETYVCFPIFTIQWPVPSWKVKAKLKEWSILWKYTLPLITFPEILISCRQESSEEWGAVAAAFSNFCRHRGRSKQLMRCFVFGCLVRPWLGCSHNNTLTSILTSFPFLQTPVTSSFSPRVLHAMFFMFCFSQITSQSTNVSSVPVCSLAFTIIRWHQFEYLQNQISSPFSSRVLPAFFSVPCASSFTSLSTQVSYLLFFSHKQASI